MDGYPQTERRRGRAKDRRRRHRHSGRRQRPHARFAQRRLRAQARADSGELAGLSRLDGIALSPLYRRRRLDHPARVGDVLLRKRLAPALLSAERSQADRGGDAPDARRASDCRTMRSCSAASTARRRFRSSPSNAGWKSWAACPTACCGCSMRRRRPKSACWAMPSSTALRGRGWCLRQSSPNPHHLARYPLADLFLDTTPYGAHTTASDALWMGVPVLTLSGRSFASRVCGSLVRSAGLTDLVVMNAKDYVERAVALGARPGGDRGLQNEIEQRSSDLSAFRYAKTGRSVGRFVSLHVQRVHPRPHEAAGLDQSRALSRCRDRARSRSQRDAFRRRLSRLVQVKACADASGAADSRRQSFVDTGRYRCGRTRMGSGKSKFRRT